MAITNGPLFSLSASGQLAKALVYGTWKGIRVVRSYVVPANPKTADQVTQRGIFADMVEAWRLYFVEAEMRNDWNRHALNDSRVMSGFNAFMSETVQLAASDPNASFADHRDEQAGNTIYWRLLNIDNGAEGNEAGNFEIWTGTSPSNLLLNEEVAIAAGDIIGTNDLGDDGDVVYAKIRKGGYDRSGIGRFTLIA